MKYDIGIDCGGTKTAYGLFNEKHELLDRFEHPTEKDGSPEQILSPIVASVKFILNKNNLSISDLRGIGLAFPSFIDIEQGIILKTSNIVGLQQFNARLFFEKQLKTKVVLDNDANVAALAEHRLGAGKGYKDMLYCAVSTGISNGIIINNHLFRGSYGAAGETGHMLITPDKGVDCGCENKGCFMSYSSGSMIVKHIQEKINQGRKTTMLEMANGNPEKIDAIILEKAALKGDVLANEMVDQMAFYLGVWLYNLYQTFNINCYVFGGGLVNFKGLIDIRARAVFNRYIKNQDNPVYFKFAELGKDFGIIGSHILIDDYIKGEA